MPCRLAKYEIRKGVLTQSSLLVFFSTAKNRSEDPRSDFEHQFLAANLRTLNLCNLLETVASRLQDQDCTCHLDLLCSLRRGTAQARGRRGPGPKPWAQCSRTGILMMGDDRSPTSPIDDLLVSPADSPGRLTLNVRLPTLCNGEGQPDVAFGAQTL